MDTFMEALVSSKTDKIPQEYDWFAPLLGDWDFVYYDGYDTDSVRSVKGEWIFRRVLNGTGIENLFICPSRETMYTDPQPDGEYGMAIRMFNSKEKCYDMAYACEKYICNLRFIKEGDKLIGTVTDDPSSKWVFADIKKDTFHWQNITVLESGEWQVNSNVFEEKSFIEKATDSGKEYLWKCGDI